MTPESDDTAPPPAPVTTPEAPFFPVGRLRVAGEASLVGAAAVAWCAFLYRLGDVVSWRVPIYQDRSDARIIANLVQNTITTGWFETTPQLGAPWGQELYDFPHGGETWQLVAIRFLSLFTSDYGLLMNVYFVAGFAVTGAVTLLVLRHLRFGAVPSMIAALLYTMLPFHFYHEQSHLFRSSYFYAPVACLVLVWAFQWRERFLRDPAGKLVWANVRPKRVAFIVAACVLLAGTETMTTAFTMTLLAATAVIGAIRHREPQRLLVNGLLVAVLAGTFFVLLYPTVNYVRAYGTNEVAARRSITDQERYGLKISRMVLPSVDHRSATLRRIGNKSQEGTPIISEGGQALTTLGVAGFVGGLFWLVFNGWGRLPDGGRRDVRSPWERRALLDNAGLVNLLATLLGTVAGLAMILSVIGLSQVRVWNRIVILIAFFSMVFALYGFERIADWVRGKVATPRPVLGLLAVGVLLFGLWDIGRPAGRDYQAMYDDFTSDRQFVAAIEATVPDGTNVFQIPVVPFPEHPPPGRMLDYDQMRPYLQSDGSTNWSYAKVKGRPLADWQTAVPSGPEVVDSLPALLGLGYTGLWVDTFGYDDDGAALRSTLDPLLGPPMTSPNGRHLYYDLVPYKRSLGLDDATLRALAEERFGVEAPT